LKPLSASYDASNFEYLPPPLPLDVNMGKEMKFKNAEKREKRCVFCCLLLKGSVFSYVFLAFLWVFQEGNFLKILP
jgi:hypothetical protein